MSRDQVRFLISGVLFGFLVGYLIAYGVHEPRVVQHAAPVPAAGNLGMSGGIGSVPTVPAGGEPGGDASSAGNEQMMTRVFEEIGALKSAIEKDPRNVTALTRLANLYHDAAKYDQAVDYYGKALQVRPADVEARTDMGICLREMGKSDEAIAQFRTSLTYDPKHWQTWLNLGVVTLFDKKDVATATQAFAKVEEFNPTFKDLPLLKEALRKASAASPGS
jgi:lipopolysaccharide biosynthesis regulator YciM